MIEKLIKEYKKKIEKREGYILLVEGTDLDILVDTNE